MRPFSRRTTLIVMALSCIMVTAVAFLTTQYARSKRLKAVATSLRRTEFVLRVYAFDNGILPTTEQGLNALFNAPPELPNQLTWRGPYMEDRPYDAWEGSINYERLDANRFYVYSNGPDRIAHTRDDIGIVGIRRSTPPWDELFEGGVVEHLRRDATPNATGSSHSDDD
jgi:general secretion pathway protein G